MPAYRFRHQLRYKCTNDAVARCVAELRWHSHTRPILRQRHVHWHHLQPLRPLRVQIPRYLHLGGPNHRSDRPSARLKAPVSVRSLRREAWRFADWDFVMLQQSRLYDVLMRLPMLMWSAFLGLVNVVVLQEYVRQADPGLPVVVYILNIAMRLSVIVYLVVIAATVLVRMRPARKARGVEPRISALIGTFLLTVVVVFPRRDLSMLVGLVSAVLTLGGNAFAVVVLTQLRASFSIMAEARQLVTEGVYRMVRHPLYLAEEIAAIGIAMQFFSLSTAAILAVQIGFQLRRMRNEEVILAETFPEYRAYRARTPRILPGIY